MQKVKSFNSLYALFMLFSGTMLSTFKLCTNPRLYQEIIEVVIFKELSCLFQKYFSPQQQYYVKLVAFGIPLEKTG